MVTQRRLGIHAFVTATSKIMGRLHVSAVAAALLTVLLLLEACLSAAPEQEFQSINCGGTEFVDSKTNITWEEDPLNNANTAGYSGRSSEVSSAYKNTTSVMSTLRYFPSDKRNRKFCYSLPVSNGSTYLLRATFLYGNYDGLDKPPLFLIIINYDLWINVNITSSAIPIMHELTFISRQKNLSICLAPSPYTSDTPFISSLELRRLEVDMYTAVTNKSLSALSEGYGLMLWKRINYGARNAAVIRHPDDPYDRIWEANTSGPTLRLSTTQVGTYYGEDSEKPPAAVMATAIKSADPEANLTLTYEGYGGANFFRVEMHFEELDETAQGQALRAFSIGFPNTSYVFTQATLAQLPIAPSLAGPNSVVIDDVIPFPLPLQITFYPVAGSMRGPMLNAIELFYYTSQPLSITGTFPDDVLAINMIQKHFNIVGYGQGDPCMPQGYEWAWIECNEDIPRHIININLTSHNLIGDIPPAINQLTSLKSVDLSHNMLNGPIPDLSMLKNLLYLDVSNNSLCGKLPFFFFQTSIKFKHDGNDRLCDGPTCDCTSSMYSNGTSRRKYIITICFTSGLCVVLLLTLILYKAQHDRTKRKKAALAIEARQKDSIDGKVISYGTKVFTYNDISNATLNFTTILGEGGFGKVYHGLLSTGEAIAVKLLADVSKQGLKLFRNEVAILSKVCHKNLVSLLGYCVENKYMLIYEYIEKGNLRDLIYGDVESIDRPLSWKTRLHIALDASQGLEYLHTGCDPIVIHRDVKSSNILLDKKMQAKVSDFGLSRLKEGDTTISYLSTVNVVGTAGYLDPVYNATDELTDKSDVYSFGIVLLELICGRPPIDKLTRLPHIAEWASSSIMQGKVEDIVDPMLANGYKAESMWKVVDVALGCVESDRMKRPKMSQVSQMLQNALELEMDESSPSSSKDISTSSSTSNERVSNPKYIKNL